MHKTLRIALIAAVMTASAPMHAEWPIEYSAEITGALGGNDFAPYYIMSNRHGVLTSASAGLLDIKLEHGMDMSRRFSYGVCAEALAGYASAVDYMRYDRVDGTWISHAERPQPVWLQQLYAEVKYRQVTLYAGLKNTESKLLDNDLTSGDMVRGTNTRPIPGVWAGFVDFVDIPLTNGWVQIDGQVGYGKFTDNGWVESHYNYFNNHINTGSYYTYKRCYFRTKPSEAFSLTVGMQTAGVFGGTTTQYRNGQPVSTTRNKSGIKEFFKMFLPTEGSEEGFYLGNSLGSWDILLRYRLPNGDTVRGYLQHPFETGSGIGFLNGFDGLWGLEYHSPTSGWLDGIVVEYIDTSNQSGPNHWDPADNPGTTLTSHTSGGDDYYNNDFYNAYANYGMSLGTPMLPAPVYNRDGFPGYVVNRLKGCHIALKGHITDAVSYRLMGGYRRGYGTIRQPLTHQVHDTSMMAEVSYASPDVRGLAVKAQVAFDCGDMLGDRFGACVSVSYRGILGLGRK